MKNIKRFTLAAALSLSMASAFAGDWYGVVSAGQSRIPSDTKSQTDSSLTGLGVTGLSSSMDDNDTGYKFQLGYKFSPNWALEGGYVDLGKFNYNATFTGGTANAQVKASGINLAAVGTYPISEQFSIFGKLGFIDAKVEENASATGPGGAGTGSASSTKVKTNYGFGASYSFSKDWGVRAEWERFSKLGDNNTTGESDVDLLSVGVVFDF